MSQKIIDTAQSGMQQILAGIALARAGYCTVTSIETDAYMAAQSDPKTEKELISIFDRLEKCLQPAIEKLAAEEKDIHGRMNDLVSKFGGPRPRLGK